MSQPARSPRLFPPFVGQHSVTFDSGDAADLAGRFPGIAIPEALARAVPKRRVEYCAGRLCARQALRACAPAQAEAPLPSGDNGEPLWPTGIVGAITHAHGYASAVVARTEHARAIGLDAERFMDDSVAAGILEQVAAREEIVTLVRAAQWPLSNVVTAVFSAKETVFKCLYPEVKRYFDFRDVTVDELNPTSGSFAARLLVTLTPRLTTGARLMGRFETDEGRICTAMILDAD